MKVITIISGVVLTLTGIWCIARPGTTFLAMAFILGISMLIHGICGVLTYVSERRHKNASGYILADSLLSLILAVVVLSDQLATEAVVPVFFGMWLLFSGLMHIMQAVAVRDVGEQNWKLVLGFGILVAVLGTTAFIQPIAGRIALIMLLGFYFVAQGISVIMLGLHIKHHK